MVGLLAVTLPLKGMAAVWMLGCAMRGDLDVGAQGVHAAAQVAAPTPEHAQAHPHAAYPGDDGAEAPCHPAGEGKAVKCSAYAPCCAATAPAAASPALVTADQVQRASPQADDAPASVTIARRHRPPIDLG